MRALIIAVTAAGILATGPAFAAMDCGAKLEQYSMMVAKSSKSAARRAKAQHMTLQGYRACMAGDELNAKKFFEEMMSSFR